MRMNLPRWPLFGLLAVLGLPALAQAQLFPNLPIRRERQDCTQENPQYKMIRQEYWGYYPTCWRKFPPGWGCPSPEAPDWEASKRKIPLVPPEPIDGGDDLGGDEPGMEPRPDEGGRPARPRDNEGLPPVPDDNVSPFDPTPRPPAGGNAPSPFDPTPRPAPAGGVSPPDAPPADAPADAPKPPGVSVPDSLGDLPKATAAPAPARRRTALAAFLDRRRR